MKYQKRLIFLFKILRFISIVFLVVFVVLFLIHAFLAVVSTIGSLEKLYEILAVDYPIIANMTIEPAIYYVCRAISDVTNIIITMLILSYFLKVIDAGTPFIDKLAKNLFRVSMVNIFLPIISTTATLIIYKIFKLELSKAMSDVSIILIGLFELLFYLVVKSAIEINENNKKGPF